VRGEVQLEGDLPANGADRTWSASFTLTRTGNGFTARAGSDGRTEVSIGSGPFKPWSPSPEWGRIPAASVALQTLHHPNTSTSSVALQVLTHVN
jgi:hypothetical protein